MEDRADTPAWSETVGDTPGQGGDQSFGLRLSGLLLRSPDGTIRLVIDQLVLTFDAGDLLGLEERPAASGSDTAMALPVDIELTRPARLLSVESAAPYAKLIHPRIEPFAFATRTTPAINHDSPRFRAQEETYLQELLGT